MMTEVMNLEFHCINAELLMEELTPAQAETLLGGYCQDDEDYPYAYIINITRNPSQPKPKSKPKSTEGTTVSGKKINSIDNSRKIYLNGVPIKGERNVIIVY